MKGIPIWRIVLIYIESEAINLNRFELIECLRTINQNLRDLHFNILERAWYKSLVPWEGTERGLNGTEYLNEGSEPETAASNAWKKDERLIVGPNLRWRPEIHNSGIFKRALRIQSYWRTFQVRLRGNERLIDITPWRMRSEKEVWLGRSLKPKRMIYKIQTMKSKRVWRHMARDFVGQAILISIIRPRSK